MRFRNEFIESVHEGVKETLARGVVAGYPIDDVRVELYDGSYHDVDSTPAAFRIAGSLAAWIAVRKGKPVLLEPVMRVEVAVPTEDAGDVMTNISGRRGLIQSWQDHGPTTMTSGQRAAGGSCLATRPTSAQGRMGAAPTPCTSSDTSRFARMTAPMTDRDSLVTAPRRPVPTLRASGIALPEPDEDRADN